MVASRSLAAEIDSGAEKCEEVTLTPISVLATANQRLKDAVEDVVACPRRSHGSQSSLGQQTSPIA